MKTLISRFVKDESGVTAIEYGLIAALVGVAIIVGAGFLGDTAEPDLPRYRCEASGSGLNNAVARKPPRRKSGWLSCLGAGVRLI